MRKELDERLCAKYPEIFRDRRGDMRETAMCWGFPEDGWYDLIDNLCADIMEHCRLTGAKVPVATQVKEKYGGLRFYIYGGDDTIWELIDAAEKLSEQTCEVCGKPGKLRTGGWIETLCNEHNGSRDE